MSRTCGMSTENVYDLLHADFPCKGKVRHDKDTDRYVEHVHVMMLGMCEMSMMYGAMHHAYVQLVSCRCASFYIENLTQTRVMNQVW